MKHHVLFTTRWERTVRIVVDAAMISASVISNTVLTNTITAPISTVVLSRWAWRLTEAAEAIPSYFLESTQA